MDIHYKRKSSCNRKELLVDIREVDGLFTRASVVDCSEAGLLVEFDSRHRRPETATFPSCYAVEDDSDEEVTEANCDSDVDVLWRENEGDPERWYPCRVLQLQPKTGWAYTPLGRWQLAKVEISNSKHSELVVNDGPFWLHRRLWRRVPADCVTADIFHKVRINLPASGCGSGSQVCCWGVSKEFVAMVRQYNNREGLEQDLPFWNSHTPEARWTDDVKFHDLSDLEMIEICQHLDICERVDLSKVSPYLHRILTSRSVQRDLIVQADTFIDNSYYLALCLSKCATPTTKVIYLVGKYFKCILSLARILEHKNVELNYLVIANNKHVTPDDFIDCYDTFLMRPELTNVCHFVVLKNCVMNFDRCTLFRDGRKGTLPCGDVCNPTFKFDVSFLKFSCRNGLTAERTMDFYRKLDRLCEPSEEEKAQLSMKLKTLDNLNDEKFELLARAFQKFHLERPVRHVAWVEMIRFHQLPCAHLLHHTVASWLQQKHSTI